jgi:tetratricopeptide (TPR) repeat protein
LQTRGRSERLVRSSARENLVSESPGHKAERRLHVIRGSLIGGTAVAAAVAAVLQSQGAVVTAVVIGLATFITAISSTVLDMVHRRQATAVRIHQEAVEQQQAVARAADARLARLNDILVTWPLRLADADPFRDLGVHWSKKVADYAHGDKLAPYIPRDADDELRAAIAGEQLVVITGPSLAGKTRAAYEAARHVLGDDALLIAPRRPREHSRSLEEVFAELDVLGDISGHGALLWLDDVDQFIRAGALDPGLLTRLKHSAGRVGVLATIRETEYDVLMDRAGASGDVAGDRSRRGLRLLAFAHVIHLEAAPSDGELDRAEHAYPGEDVRHGIGAQLISAAQLVERLQAARGSHPHCHAIVNAAVDWSRTGIVVPIAKTALFRLARSGAYRARVSRGTTMDDDQLSGGLARALRPLESGVAMLYPVGDEGTTFEPFDYLIAFAEGEVEDGRGARPVPEEAWRAALDVADAADALDVGLTAYWREMLNVAESALRQAMTDSDFRLSASLMLATVLRDGGALSDARQLLESTMSQLDADDPDAADDIAVFRYTLALTLRLQGDWNGARELAAAAAAGVEGREDLRATLAESLVSLSGILNELKRHEAAYETIERAFALVSEPDFPDDENPFLAGSVWLTRGVVLRDLDRTAEAKSALEHALEAIRELVGEDHHVVGVVRMMLATVAWRCDDAAGALRQADDAIAIMERYFGSEHAALIDPVGTRGGIRRDLGDNEAALGDLDRAIGLAQRLLPDNHELTIRFVTSRSRVRLNMGDLDGGALELEQAERMAEKRYGAGHPEVVESATRTGWLLKHAGDVEGARRAFKRALATRTHDGTADDRIFASALYGLGVVREAEGDHIAAISAYREALELYDPNDPAVPGLLLNLAEADRARGDLLGARAALERALTIVEGAGGQDEHDAGRLLTDLGEIRLLLDEHEPAAGAFERALTIERREHGLAHPAVVRAVHGLARVRQVQGDATAARSLLEMALDAADADEATEAHVAEILAELRDLGESAPRGRSAAAARGPAPDGLLDSHAVVMGRLRRSILENDDLSADFRAHANDEELRGLDRREQELGSELLQALERYSLLNQLKRRWPAQRAAFERGAEEASSTAFERFYESLWRESLEQVLIVEVEFEVGDEAS